MKLKYSFTALAMIIAMAGTATTQTPTVKIIKQGETILSLPAEEIDYMTVVNQLDAPTNFKTELSDNSITITWGAVSGATEYIVSRSGDNITFTEIAKVKGTSYTDTNPLSGANYYRVKAVGTDMEASEESGSITPVNFGNMESGMYLGIIGFNQKLFTMPIQLLNASTQNKFNTYIDDLNNNEGLTALYYAVDKGVDVLKGYKYPEDICNASIITFTDGLDNHSLMLQPDPDYDEEQYLSDVHNKICSEKIQNIDISAYAIGLKAKDVSNDTMFTTNLKGLSTKEEYAKEAKDMAEVNKTLRDIASELYNTSIVQSVNVCIPGGRKNGTRIRFTFDIMRHEDEVMQPEQAIASKVYIEGDYYRSDLTLRNLRYEGLELGNVDNIKGFMIEEGENKGYISFTFDGIVCHNNKRIEKQYILEWWGDPFNIESEFLKGEKTKVLEHKKTAAILLVLDCTYSMDDASFSELKKIAKQFISTLVEGYKSPSDPPGTVVGENDVKIYTVNGVSFKMVPVNGGTFYMGATSEQSNGYTPDSDENPVHQVSLSDYYIGETEVTQALWYAVTGMKTVAGYNWSSIYGAGDDYPVYFVSYDECKKFITKLNELTGETFRMPTEAEWEYAARGGNKSKGYIFSGSDNLDEVAWYSGNSDGKTHPVGMKKANELGIYDMSGNVWEWCSDWYSPSYISNAKINLPDSSTSIGRVSRGGCWYYFAPYSRVAYRYFSAPGDRYFDLGLRLAK